MSSIYQNLKNDRQFSASTGLTKAEFEELFSVFERLYQPKKNNLITNREAALSNPREALFFILHYYKSYPTLQNLALYFGFSDKTASIYLEELKPVLKGTLARCSALAQRLFRSQKQVDEAFEGVDDLCIDVSELNVQRPDNQDFQRTVYSGKKSSYGKMAAHNGRKEAHSVCRTSLEWRGP